MCLMNWLERSVRNYPTATLCWGLVLSLLVKEKPENKSA